MDNYLGSNYRDEILIYFSQKDIIIYEVLYKNKEDWGVPFNTLYQFHYNSINPIDLVGYMLSCMILNRYKPQIKQKSSFSLPKRGKKFINRLINENLIYSHISAISLTTYVSGQILDRLEKNKNFDWFIKSKTLKGNNPEFIIIDTYNFFLRIKTYQGYNRKINTLKNEIIGNNSLKKCITDIALYLSEQMNDNDYKYILVSNFGYEELNDYYYIVSSDCNDYIGTDCSKENLSGEVDDCVTLMLYDYINYYHKKIASILSEDNYDFSIISQDFSYQIERSFIDIDGNIINYQDIELKYPDFNFSREGGLTLFGENLELIDE